jgi:hypothetical protein
MLEGYRGVKVSATQHTGRNSMSQRPPTSNVAPALAEGRLAEIGPLRLE